MDYPVLSHYKLKDYYCKLRIKLAKIYKTKTSCSILAIFTHQRRIKQLKYKKQLKYLSAVPRSSCLHPLHFPDDSHNWFILADTQKPWGNTQCSVSANTAASVREKGSYPPLNVLLLYRIKSPSLMPCSGTKLRISKFATNDLSTLSTPISCENFLPANASPLAIFNSLQQEQKRG